MDRLQPAFAAMLIALLGLGRGLRAAETASRPLALRGARLVTIDEAGALRVVPRSAVVLRDGRIAELGEATLPLPPECEVIELEGQWLLPGFIDAHWQLPPELAEANETSEAVTPEFDPLPALAAWELGLERLGAQGVTAVAVAPGELDVVGGRVRLVKVAPREARWQALAPAAGAAPIKVSVGIEAVLHGLARAPTAPSGTFQILRQWLATQPAAGAEGAPPQALFVHLENRSQAERVRELCAPRALAPVFLHARGLDRAAWELLGGRPQAILGPFDLGDPERLLAGPAAVERLGGTIAFATDGEPRDLLTSAVLARRAGLSLRGALAALSADAARLLGVEGRIGRIARGHDADLVAWSGNPFSLNARVLAVWIEGRRVLGAAGDAAAAGGGHAP